MKVAIGPLTNKLGATGRITQKIVKYSTKEVIPFSPLFYYKYLERFATKAGIKIYDPYGFYLSYRYLQNFDIIHFMNHPLYREVHFRPSNPVSKYVYRIPGFYKSYIKPSQRNYHLYKKLDDWMIDSCKSCDCIIVGNSWFQNYLKKNYNLDSIIVNNGIDTKLWASGISERFSKNYNIKSNFCLFAGRLSPEKGPDFFVHLAREMPDLQFVMIGPQITRPNVENYLKASIPQNLFCLGRLSGKDLHDCFNSAGILINPAKSKYGGNVILEAMASKTIPIVSVESSDDPLWFEPFSEGLTYEHNNLQDCIKMLRYAIDNSLMSNNAYKKILTHYDWSIVIKKYDEIYDGLA